MNLEFRNTLYTDNHSCLLYTSQENTFLRKWTQKTRIYVNSHHHQAVKSLAEGFYITAESADGVIEAIESTGETPMIGVQWHPEALDVYKRQK